jgi:hypothetical protein
MHLLGTDPVLEEEVAEILSSMKNIKASDPDII